MLIIITIIYFLPTIIVMFKNKEEVNLFKPNQKIMNVFLINIFLWWTIIFWFISLFIALEIKNKW